MGKGTTTLLIIDPQNDFHPGGSLAIPSADEDARRLALFISSNAAAIDEIVVTLDSHHKLHIAHAAFWRGGADADLRPAAFSVIHPQDVTDKTWLPRDPSLVDYCVEYLSALEKSGKFMLVVWPEHCLIGSHGHAVYPAIDAALHVWLDYHADSSRAVRWVSKGENCLTEMYSALAAEVPVPSDPRTHLNEALRADLLPAPPAAGTGSGGAKGAQLIVAGQAKSHCVAATVRDILGPSPSREQAAATVLLEDCMSSVVGFEEAGEAFVAEMREAGVVVCAAAECSPGK